MGSEIIGLFLFESLVYYSNNKQSGLQKQLKVVDNFCCCVAV